MLLYSPTVRYVAFVNTATHCTEQHLTQQSVHFALPLLLQTGTGKTWTTLGENLWEMAASTRLTGSAGEPPPASLSKLTREDGPGGLIPRCAAWLLAQAAAASSGSSAGSSSAHQRSGSKGGRSAAPPAPAAPAAQPMHISVSYLEIYNEKVYDLLALRPAATTAGAAAGGAHAAATPSLEIKIDGLGGVYVPGCTELRVRYRRGAMQSAEDSSIV
jgi:Kinesin motor domain